MPAAGRPPPTTFECVEAIALAEPNRLALVQDERRWTYASLYGDLLRAARVLAELGVKRGDRVAVGMEGFQAGIVLLLAAESLGAVTTSFLARNDADASRLFAIVDWVFSDLPQDAPAGPRNVRVDAAFVRRIEAAGVGDPQAVPRVVPGFGEPHRIARTSGSSGLSKFMLLSRGAQEYWICDVAGSVRLHADARLMVTGPLVPNGTFARVSACLRLGAAVLDAARLGTVPPDVTHLAAMPSQLETVMRALPPGYRAARPIDVCTVGGFVAPSIRAAAARVFGGRVLSRYGTNEAGAICDDLDANGVGVAKAGVDIRIVDEGGAEVPPGQAGIVAVRTPNMVAAYVDEPGASRDAFRDGWFYTGDWGALVRPRVLRLMGRRDDLVNAGGTKIPASTVEAQVRGLVQPKDCAVVSVNLDGGAVSLGIALVAAPDAPRELLRRRLAEGLQLGATVGAKVLFLERLPVLGTGKLDRAALHRLFASPPPSSV